MTKEECRKECLKNTKNAKRVHDTISNIVNSKVIQDDHIIAIYFPLKNEIDILELMTQYPMKVFCFPRIEDNLLAFYIVEDTDCLVKGPHNTLQPHKNKKDLVEINDINAFFIPCIGINKNQHRLGYGHGYYDRTLENITTKKIGVCYSENLDADFIEEPHDIKLDYVFKR